MTAANNKLTRPALLASSAIVLLSGICPAMAQGDDGEKQLEKVVIVGSHIGAPSTSFDTAAQPIQYLTRNELENTPAESAADFLRGLPINTGISNSSTTDEYAGGRSSINLRGVGAQYTLVLVDGRRLAGENIADIGAIPAEAIEGVEVLKTGASAIYGSDAVAGVVNVRLRKDFNGLELTGSYGAATEGGAETTRIAGIFGFSKGPVSLTASLAYQDREGFNKYDRELTASRDYTAYGGLDRRSSAVGSPHNIILASGASAGQSFSIDLDRFSPGYVPTGIGDFTAYDFDRQAESTNEYGTYPPQERLSGHWSGSFEAVPGKLEFYTSGLLDIRDQDFIANQPFTDVFVAADNPNNPFGENVVVVYAFGEDAAGLMTEHFETTSFQGTGGFKGSLADWFNYDVGYTYYKQTIDERYENDIDYASAQAAATSGVFNPFCYWCNTQEVFDLISPTSAYTSENSVKTFDVTVSGDLFDPGTGTIQYAAGYQHRDVSFSLEPDAAWQSAGYWWLGGPLQEESGSRTVDAFFGELRVPLYSASAQNAFFQSAEVRGALRQEEYSDFGSSTVGQVLGRVGLLGESMVLRASYAETFRAPSVSALTDPERRNTEAGGFYYDPVRDGFLPVDRIYGGNPELDPERGETYSFGVVLRPDFAPNLFFTADYWDMEISDIIRQPDGQGLLDGTETAGSVTRDPVTLYPTLDLRLDNGGLRSVSGIDLSAVYNFETGAYGNYSLLVNATRLLEFEESGGAVTVDYLDEYSSAFGPMPKLRLAGSLSGDWGALDASFGVKYTDGYRDFVASANIDRRVDAYTTADIQVGYDFDAAPVSERIKALSGLRAYVGIENVFNPDLPFVAESTDGWDRYIGDLRGRYVYAGLKKTF